MLVMFLNSAESVLLILLGHFDEVAQAFLELLGSFSGTVNKTDPDPLVGV